MVPSTVTKSEKTEDTAQVSSWAPGHPVQCLPERGGVGGRDGRPPGSGPPGPAFATKGHKCQPAPWEGGSVLSESESGTLADISILPTPRRIKCMLRVKRNPCNSMGLENFLGTQRNFNSSIQLEGIWL